MAMRVFVAAFTQCWKPRCPSIALYFACMCSRGSLKETALARWKTVLAGCSDSQLFISRCCCRGFGAHAPVCLSLALAWRVGACQVALGHLRQLRMAASKTAGVHASALPQSMTLPTPETAVGLSVREPSQLQPVEHVTGAPSGRSLLQESSVPAGYDSTTIPAPPFEAQPPPDLSPPAPPVQVTSWPSGPGIPPQDGSGGPPGSFQEGAARPPPLSLAIGFPPSPTAPSKSTISATSFFTSVTDLSLSATPPSEVLGLPPPAPPPPSAPTVSSPPLGLRPRSGGTQFQRQNTGGSTSQLSGGEGDTSEGGLGPPSLSQQVSSGVLDSSPQTQADTGFEAFALLQGR